MLAWWNIKNDTMISRIVRTELHTFTIYTMKGGREEALTTFRAIQLGVAVRLTNQDGKPTVKYNDDRSLEISGPHILINKIIALAVGAEISA